MCESKSRTHARTDESIRFRFRFGIRFRNELGNGAGVGERRQGGGLYRRIGVWGRGGGLHTVSNGWEMVTSVFWDAFLVVFKGV